MKKNQIRYLLISAILLVIFHVLAFVIPFAHTALFWCSYAFGLLAILAQIPMMALAFKHGTDAKSQFYGFPILRIVLLYVLVQFVLSLAFMALSLWVPAWIAVIVYVLVLGAALLGLIAADTTRDEILEQDQKLKKDVSKMRTLQSLGYSLISQTEDPEVKRQVEQLAEALRYSDPVSSPALEDAENELAACMDELQRALLEEDKSGAIGICKRAEAALAERNRLCKLHKKDR